MKERIVYRIQGTFPKALMKLSVKKLTELKDLRDCVLLIPERYNVEVDDSVEVFRINIIDNEVLLQSDTAMFYTDEEIYLKNIAEDIATSWSKEKCWGVIYKKLTDEQKEELESETHKCYFTFIDDKIIFMPIENELDIHFATALESIKILIGEQIKVCRVKSEFPFIFENFPVITNSRFLKNCILLTTEENELEADESVQILKVIHLDNEVFIDGGDLIYFTDDPDFLPIMVQDIQTPKQIPKYWGCIYANLSDNQKKVLAENDFEFSLKFNKNRITFGSDLITPWQMYGRVYGEIQIVTVAS